MSNVIPMFRRFAPAPPSKSDQLLPQPVVDDDPSAAGIPHASVDG